MPLTHDLAICLRRLDYSETSQILLLFTRAHGLVRVIAKGAKRTTKAGDSKFSGGVDLLEAGRIVMIHAPERDLSQLTEWSLARGHLPLRRDLRRLYLGQFAGEMVTLVFEEHDPHCDVFDDLVEVLRQLSDDHHGEQAVLAFVLRLLRSAGLLPDLSRCVGCGRPPWNVATRAYFSLHAAGGVCAGCESLFPDRMTLSSPLLRTASQLIHAVAAPATAAQSLRPRPLRSLTLPALAHDQTQPLFSLLEAHVAHQQGRGANLSPFLAATSRSGRYQHPPIRPNEPWMPALPIRPLDPEPTPEPVQVKPRRPNRKPRPSAVARDLSDVIISPSGPITDSPPPPPTTAAVPHPPAPSNPAGVANPPTGH